MRLPAVLLFTFVFLVSLTWRDAVAEEDHQHALSAEEIGSVRFFTSCPKNLENSFNRAVALLHSFQYEQARRRVQVRTGKLFPEVWAKFLLHDPVNMVEHYANNLRKLRYRFVDCGTKDQFHLYLGSRQLHEQLDAHNIAHIYEEYDSDHFLLRRQQELKTIPAMVAALKEE